MCKWTCAVRCIGCPKVPQDFVNNVVREFDTRRYLVYRRANEIDVFCCMLPKGAFYVFPSIKAFGMSSKEFAEFLVEAARVTIAPGSSFGSYGEGYIRIFYTPSYEKLGETLDRIEKAVKQIK